jgi:hypothetical protein
MMFHGSDAASPAVPKVEEPGTEQIRTQLDRVLTSPLFRSSHRCQALLRYVTERAIAGDTANLKERALGIDVFGRAPDYDTNADPIIRTTAGEIRKKLAQYYQDPGHAGELRIELNRGAYVPEFHSPPSDPAAAEPPPAVPPAQPRWSKVSLALIAVGALAILAVPLGLLSARWQTSDLDRFWRPMLDSPGGVLFSIAQPRVYNFRSDSRQAEIEKMIEGMAPSAFESSQQLIPLSQLVPMWDRYMALGDVTCLLRLASVFEKRGKAYRVRSEATTSFSDLRERPAVLVGAFDNAWTLRAVGEMRYTFYKDFQGLELVRDRDHPELTDWKLVNSWPYWNIPNDYAIVSRVFDQHTDRMVVVAAGITHFGTAGAGEFLSNPQYFGEAVPQLPRDWTRRNLQIVLRIPVVQGASGHPRVLATHVW